MSKDNHNPDCPANEILYSDGTGWPLPDHAQPKCAHLPGCPEPAADTGADLLAEGNFKGVEDWVKDRFDQTAPEPSADKYAELLAAAKEYIQLYNCDPEERFCKAVASITEPAPEPSADILPCPCGQIPASLVIDREYKRSKWANVSAPCCGEWSVEFHTGYKEDSELNEIAREAWNNAPRDKAREQLAAAEERAKKWAASSEKNYKALQASLLELAELKGSSE